MPTLDPRMVCTKCCCLIAPTRPDWAQAASAEASAWLVVAFKDVCVRQVRERGTNLCTQFQRRLRNNIGYLPIGYRTLGAQSSYRDALDLAPIADLSGEP